MIAYSPGAAPAAYTAAADAIQSKAGVKVLSSRAAPAPELIVNLGVWDKTTMPSAANWGLVTLAGDCVIFVQVMPLAGAEEIPAGAPGLAYMRTLATIVRAKATGDAAPKLPLAGETTPLAVPRAYLKTADLGDGVWQAQ